MFVANQYSFGVLNILEPPGFGLGYVNIKTQCAKEMGYTFRANARKIGMRKPIDCMCTPREDQSKTSNLTDMINRY